MKPEHIDSELPVALSIPERRWSLLIWLLPIIAAAFAAWLVFQTLAQRGIPIEIQFQQGHGLKPGDTLRYRGIAVGTVSDVMLTGQLDGIRVIVQLSQKAEALARTGSRFWIVRPQLNLSGASGLDTVIGANYLSVLPGSGVPQKHFVGLDETPPAGAMIAGGLEIVLTTPGKGGLRAGAPVSYRQIVIGAIVDVDLATDASAVEAKVYIEPDYLSLIRENTKFWKIGGARFRAGLGGLSLDVDSVHSLVLGGVNLALPPAPGNPVNQGHVFELYEEPKDEWLEWAPSLALFDDPGATLERPPLLPVTLTWTYKAMLYLEREGNRQGWVLPLTQGLLGPSDLLAAPEDALADSITLSIDGAAIEQSVVEPYSEDLALLPLTHDYTVWPAERLRNPSAPENVQIIAAAALAPRFVGAHRLQADNAARWLIDASLPFDASWHGAAVVGQTDGAVIGLLLVNDERAWVATLPTITP